MRINHNIAALNTHRQLNTASTGQAKSMEKLSSGLRINRAGDDAAGLAISEKMRGQIRGLDQASRNAQDGISLIQTAEGALNETHDILQRMRELGVQAANDTNTSEDRDEIQKEMNQLTSEISRIGNNTEFNTKKVINGDLESATGAQQETFSFDLQDFDGAADTGSVVLSLGGENYTINFADTGVGTANTFNAGTKSITINTNVANANVGDDVIDAFQSMRGADPSLKISEYTFTKNSDNTFTVATTALGEFDGSKGNDTIKAVSGIDAGRVTEDFDGTDGASGAINVQVGSNKDQLFTVDISDMRSSALGISGGDGVGATFGATFASSGDTSALDENSGSPEYALDVTDSTKATAAIKVIDEAINSVSAERSKLGAFQNRLEHTINNLNTSSENLTAAESRIRDVDYALAA
jgi:flagellin